MGDRIECTQDIEALSSGSGIDKIALEAPQKTKKRLEDKVRRVDEVNVFATLLRILQVRL